MIIDMNEIRNQDHESKCKSAVSKCKYIHRIITALRYYQLLNKTNQNNEYNGQIVFSDFLSEQYKYYMDDLIHLKVCHDKDLKEIYDSILAKSQNRPCDINKCIFIDRHCEIRDGKNGDIDQHKNKIEPLSSLHIQIWDSVHYYLCHLFDVGLRELSEYKADNDHNNVDSKSNDKWGITDKSMNRRGKEMKRRRAKLGRFFGRFDNTNNKFTIQSVIKSSSVISGPLSPNSEQQGMKYERFICLDII